MFFESLKYKSVNVGVSIPFSGIQVCGWLFPAGHLANLSAQQSPSVWPAVGQGGIWITQGAGRLHLEHHQGTARTDSRPGHPVGCGSHTSDAHQASPQAHTQPGQRFIPPSSPSSGPSRENRIGSGRSLFHREFGTGGTCQTRKGSAETVPSLSLPA